MVFLRWPAFIALPAILALAACQSAPPAGPPASRPVTRAARPSPPTPSRVEGAWSFGVAGDRCTAQVAHREATLGITAGPGRTVTLSVGAPGRRSARSTRIAFRGDEGAWEAQGRGGAGRLALATMPLDEAAEGRIRDLLGGGTVTVQAQGVEVPALGVPDAGVSGRDWYGCVSRLAER